MSLNMTVNHFWHTNTTLMKLTLSFAGHTTGECPKRIEVIELSSLLGTAEQIDLKNVYLVLNKKKNSLE